MTRGDYNVKAAVLEECPTCSRERFLTDAGECVGCVIDVEHEAEQKRRAEAWEYDRQVLGFMPAAKSIAFTRMAINAGLYWTDWASKFVSAKELRSVEETQVHLARARRALAPVGAVRPRKTARTNGELARTTTD